MQVSRNWENSYATKLKRHLESLGISKQISNTPSRFQILRFVDVIILHVRELRVGLVTREFTKPRRQRQPERNWTKELMSKTIAVYVHYNSRYISLPSTAKQQREMTKFCVVWRTWATTANFLNFYFKFITASQIQFRDSFDSYKQSKWL